jgi:putative transposase
MYPRNSRIARCRSFPFIATPSDSVLRPPVESAQYTSGDYAALAAELGVTLSLGRKGQCWDNAVSESWFATFKNELVYTRPWPTIAALRAATFEFIEGWYNTRRLHSSLGYRSPADYEATIHRETAARAA